MKYDALASGKIGCRHGERDTQLFESFNFQKLVQESDHALVAGEAVAGERPTGNVFEADAGSDLLKLRGRNPTAVSGTDEGAYAGSGNAADGDVFFFEDFEDAYMGDTSSKASTQSQTYADVALS